MVEFVNYMTSILRCLYPLKLTIQGGYYGEVGVI
jgi:hypothetical protein